MVPPGRRVTLKGMDCTFFLVLTEGNAAVEVNGLVATDAGEIVKKESPTEMVLLNELCKPRMGCLGNDICDELNSV